MSVGLSARKVHLRHARATNDAVRELHLELRPGEILALVGPNGSGKSTLLAGLARALPLREGEVTLDGRPLSAWPRKALRRQLAWLPQEPVCPEGLTVEELVLSGRNPHLGAFAGPGEADRAAIRAALRRLDLEELARRPVDHLSGGERKRVWLAMALCQEADVLLLDEPTAALDLRHQLELLDLLGKLNRDRGTTLCVVLHDLEQAARLAHRIAVLHRGRLYRAGTPEECLTAETFLDVFGVEAEVSRVDGRLRFRILGPGDPLRRL